MGRTIVALIAALALCASVSFAGGAKETAPAKAATAAVSVAKGKFGESPYTLKLVNEGKLRPVDERIPQDPVVSKWAVETGKYGGVLKSIVDPKNPENNVMHMGMRANLVGRGPNGEYVPRVAKSWEIAADNRSITFRLPKGLRWSDGVPFTTEDIKFAWEDVSSDRRINAASSYALPNIDWKFEFPDEYTFRIIDTQPRLTWALDMSKFSPYILYYAKHYYKDFVPKYNPKITEKEFIDKMRNNGLEIYNNPAVPSLFPWKLMEFDVAGRILFERNPYFYMVDGAGNQLPYVDQLQFKAVPTTGDSWVLEALTGELGVEWRSLVLKNLPLLKEAEDAGKLKLGKWYSPMTSQVSIYMNHTVADEVLRKIFQDIRFKKALSFAINRAEMNKVLYFNLGTPIGVSTGSIAVPYYDKSLDTLYAQYDPQASMKLLDEMGVVDKDGDGVRERPDGRKLVLFMEYPWNPEVFPMVIDYWRAIGLKAEFSLRDRQYFYAKVRGGNDFEMSAEQTGVGYWDITAREPFGIGIFWDFEWKKWLKSGGKEGQEPLPFAKEMNGLWKSIMAANNMEEANRLSGQLIKVAADNIVFIGLVGRLPTLYVVNKNLRNVPLEIQNSGNWVMYGADGFGAESWYYK